MKIPQITAQAQADGTWIASAASMSTISGHGTTEAAAVASCEKKLRKLIRYRASKKK